MPQQNSEVELNPQKVGSAAEALCARLQAISRSERDFMRKGGATA